MLHATAYQCTTSGMWDMRGLNRRKFITAGIACGFVCIIVVALDRSGALSGLINTSSAASAGLTVGGHSLGGASTTSKVVVSKTAASSVVNINTASENELMTLTGIGPAKASAIVRYRSEKGVFYKIEDIMHVKGIGQSMFANMRDHIIVGDVKPPPYTATSDPTPVSATSRSVHKSVPTPVQAAHIIITQVMTGMKGNPKYEFVELYNAGSDAVDLTGWNMKKRSSSGSISTLVAASRLSGKHILAHAYFLAASDGYTGTPADITWPSSYTLASAHNSVILEESDGRIADTVAWNTIPEGGSYIRTSPESNDFAIGPPQPHSAR